MPCLCYCPPTPSQWPRVFRDTVPHYSGSKSPSPSHIQPCPQAASHQPQQPLPCPRLPEPPPALGVYYTPRTGAMREAGGCALMNRLMSSGEQLMMLSRSSRACSRDREPSMAYAHVG